MPLGPFTPATRAWFEATFEAPTRVQAGGWPPVSGGEHTLMLAPTGTGKTLAAFLWAIDRLSRPPATDAARKPGFRIVYISPLKALAYDVERNLRAPLVGIRHYADRLDQDLHPLRIDVRTGDTPQRERARMGRDPGDILITTPESLYLLLGSNARENLETVDTVIVDEIHAVAGSKRGVHLALSLERLAERAESDPQRIGLSATQRPLEEMASFLGGGRDVQVVDRADPPAMDLKIVVPVPDMTRPAAVDPVPRRTSGPLVPPAAPTPQERTSIWPAVYPRLLEQIQSHTSTIVFTNSRILCERLAQRLNELAGEELVRAHHGSIARHRREEIEEQLKAGTLKALVATSSLELGIDMGAVDLVLLVESPGSVARGLQRIGRAGHGVGQLSVGRLFPKYRGDLLEATVVGQAMREGAIEPTRVPRNCLDVLSQQIVACVSMDDWPRDDLLTLVRRATPYRELSAEVFTAVLDMLSGRYPSAAFADLRPRITWDREADVLSGRKGSRALSLINGGTIPDRGLYRVQLGEGGPILGELDEEMVFESRSGETFVLGASTWRIESITGDRVMVTPAPGEPGRLPFWHGEGPGRPLDLGRRMGAFVRELTDRTEPEAATWLEQDYGLDPHAARNLLAYIRQQREATGTLPTDRAITVESFQDELGDWRVCVLSPFGTRVHAPWALCVEAHLSTMAGFDVQAFWTDDGLVFRFAELDHLEDIGVLFPEPEEVEEQLMAQLTRSALFAARFREAAGRALLLPRRYPGKRSPLWIQRKKSQELMAAVSGYPGFPIVLETYRECLQDVFDLDALKEVLGAIRDRIIRVDEVETRSASPFARSLVFAYTGSAIYDGDVPLAERRALALSLDRNLLRELLGTEQLRNLLDADAMAAVEAELQGLAEGRQARDADELHDLLRRVGSLSQDELGLRCTDDPGPWLAQLLRQRRAVQLRVAHTARWIAAEDAARLRDGLGAMPPPGLPDALLTPVDDPLTDLVRRYARTHGPFTSAELADRLGLLPAQVAPVLKGLEAAGVVVQGELRPGGTTTEWCDEGVLRRIRRRSLALLRDEVAPVEADVLARFLPRWHGLDLRRVGPRRLEEVVAQLEGVALPWSDLERTLLPARIPRYDARLLDELGAMGGVVWVGRGALGPKDGRVALYRRERAPLLLDPPEPSDDLSVLAHAVLKRLQDRGACFVFELQTQLDADAEALQVALWDLVWAGLVTNDTFAPLRQLRAPKRRRKGRLTRVAGGRWSAVSTLLGGGAEPTRRAHARATGLLERYGVVTREAALAEDLPGGFAALYPVLRAMEEAGKARRGWFVEGLGGAQFALPGAVDRLRSAREPSSKTPGRVLAAVDPASPWGGLVSWPESPGGQARRAAGAQVVLVEGALVFWIAPGGRRLLSFAPAQDERTLERALAALSRAALGGRRKLLRVETIDGVRAGESPLAGSLARVGFRADPKGLVLEAPL